MTSRSEQHLFAPVVPYWDAGKGEQTPEPTPTPAGNDGAQNCGDLIVWNGRRARRVTNKHGYMLISYLDEPAANAAPVSSAPAYMPVHRPS